MNVISIFHTAFIGRASVWHEIKVTLWESFAKDYPMFVRQYTSRAHYPIR